MSVVTIVGSGMMGSALAFPAAENGNEVRLVGTHLDNSIIDTCIKCNRHPKFDRDFSQGVRFYHIEDIDRAISGSDVIVGGISSFGVDWFADKILPRIPEGMPVLTVTKGLFNDNNGNLIPYPYIWENKLTEIDKKLDMCAVGGPCTSYELVAHDQTEVVFCGRNRQVLEMLREIFRTDYYHIGLSDDVIGIESAVALKNGYALAVALTIGINQKRFGDDSPLHFNSQAAVFYQAAKEMSLLLKFQGADDIHNLCVGLGDLYVTVYGGRTRQIGILLGKGLDIDEAKKILNGVTLESLVVSGRVADSIRMRAAKGLLSENDFPLLLHVDDILNHGKKDIPWEKFVCDNWSHLK